MNMMTASYKKDLQTMLLRTVHPVIFVFIALSLLLSSVAYAQSTAGVSSETNAQAKAKKLAIDKNAPLANQVETLKQAAIELNRDLLILEEDLLFPGNTQVAVFVSMNVGKFFGLDALKVKIDGKVVASHLYTDKQIDALLRGGIQRIYMGNVKSGKHEISAFFTGTGPEGREFKRAAKLNFVKASDPSLLEIRVVDSKEKIQPVFDIKEWQL